MEDIDGTPIDLYRDVFGVASCPAVGVDIPPNRGDRSNPAELVEDFFPANVASMNDMGDRRVET